MEFSRHQFGELFMDFNCPWNSPHKFAYGVEGSIFIVSCVKVKLLVPQLCPTLCDPMDCSLPGSSVYGILQARILEWIAIPFFRGYISCIGWQEKAMASHSSTLAWKSPWTEEPGRLPYMGSQRVGHDWATNTPYANINSKCITDINVRDKLWSFQKKTEKEF